MVIDFVWNEDSGFLLFSFERRELESCSAILLNLLWHSKPSKGLGLSKTSEERASQLAIRKLLVANSSLPIS